MSTRRSLAAVLISLVAVATLACAAPTAAPTPAPKAAPTSAPAAKAAPTSAPAAKAAPTTAPAAKPAPTSAPTAKSTTKPESATVRLGYLVTYWDTTIVVAMQEKLFEREGLNMDYKLFTQGRASATALVAGAVDIATMAVLPFVTSSSKGGIVSIGVEQYNPDSIAVVVGKDSPIKQVPDLKGKKIGSSAGTLNNYVLVNKLLPRHGLKPSDYQVVNMDIPNMMAALSAGAIDAFAASDPFPVQAEELGVGRILIGYDASLDPLVSVLAAQQAFVEANPTTVLKFVKAYMRASKLIAEDKAKASKIMRDYEASLKVELTQRAADMMINHVDPTPFYMPKFAQYLDELAQDQKSMGNIDTVPNWDKIVLTEFQDKAAAELGIKNRFK